MSAAASLRKGWCPGALRPMPSGDGLLVRLRLSCGELPVRTASAIAALGEKYGNGGIDLTQRANLQLRGLREADLPALTAALDDLGLLDANPGAEAVRNVMVSPLSGLDPTCRDGRAIARALEAQLRSDTALHALPAKFGFAIDGGGRWPLGAAGADIALCAHYSEARWQIALAGGDAISEPIEEAQVAEMLVSLAKAFLRAGQPRMRDLAARDGAAAVLAAAGLATSQRDHGATGQAHPAPGVHGVSSTIALAAVGLPFGWIEAGELAALAGACQPETVIRLTPWRMLIVPFIQAGAAEAFLKICGAHVLITSPSDPRTFIDACTGAPGCANATTRTREDAARLAGEVPHLLSTKSRLHVSVCAKGCAHRGSARFTLVGHDGRYDLILHGAPGDAPHRTGIAPAALAAALREGGHMP